ncbi:MAG: carbohydrate ABC transporter permease [Anaerolineales bacterium]|jgi:ABC-type glycerol-3-phosphate transport system permease component
MSAETAISNPSQRRQRSVDQLKKWIGHVPAYLVLGAWSLFTLFMLVWVILASLKSNRDLYKNIWALPTQIHFENFTKALFTIDMGKYFLNSLVVVMPSIFIILALSAPASYVLSRKIFKGSNLITMIFIAGIGIPLPLLFIPLFVILTALHINNTLYGLGVLYIATSLPFTVFMLTGFFGSLPVELEEAATIDGASDFQVFFRVMLPLASPGLITAAIFDFIGIWNEYQLALVFLNDPNKSTLSLGLYTLTNAMQYTGDWTGLMAGVVIVMVPTIILYIILSEKMIAGITMGAVK